MQADVLVVGAGPAGSALAARLAREGWSVLLADKKQFPRDKPCGEFLSPQCVPLLERLGAHAAVAALGPRLVRGMHLHGEGIDALGRFRRLADRPASSLAGYGIRRERFDLALMQHAIASGASWLPRHAFELLHRDAGGRITGARLRRPDGSRVDVRARWVVGADGVHSHVARELGVQRPVPWLDKFALVAHYRGVQPAPFAEVHLMRDGYFAATTVDDGLLALNLVVDRQRLRARPPGDHDAFVARWLAQAPQLAERLRSAQRLQPWRGIGPLAHRSTAIVFDGAALAGDACGYADPLTGEGIYFALFTAEALGDALVRAAAEPAKAATVLRAYAAAHRREIGPRIAASLLLQRSLRHPWLVRSFLRAARRWPAFADLVVTLTGDSIHPRELTTPAFWRAFRAAEAS